MRDLTSDLHIAPFQAAPAERSASLAQPRLSSALIRLVLAALLPLLVFGVTLLVYLGQKERAAGLERVETTARRAAESIQHGFHEHVRLLQAAAASGTLDQGEFAAFHAEALRILALYPSWSHLMLHEAGSGRELVNTAHPPGTPAPPLTDMERFQPLMRSGAPYVLVSVRLPEPGEPCVCISVPVRRGDAVPFVLSGALTQDAIQRMLTGETFQPGWMASLSDAKGTLIAGIGGIQRFLGRKISPELQEAIANTRQGVIRKRTPDREQDVYTAIRQVAGTGWVVTVGAPARQLDDPWRRTLLFAGIGGLVSIGGAAGLAALLGRDVLRLRQDEHRALMHAAHLRLLNVSENFPGLVFRREQGPDGKVAYPFLVGTARDLVAFAPRPGRCASAARMFRVHDDDLAAFRRAFDRSAMDLSPLRLEVRLQAPQGAPRWMFVSARPCRDGAGNIVWDGVMLDISELRATEDALRSSEERLRFALEASRVYTWEWDIVSRTIHRSANAGQVLRFPQEAIEPTYKWFVKRVHPDDRERMGRLNAELLQAGGDFSIDYRFLCGDGRHRWLTDRGRVVLGDDGQPLSAKGVTFNITEHKRAEQALRASEEELRFALDAAHVFTWEWDPGTRTFRRSANAASVLGVAPDEVEPTHEWLRSRIHPDDLAQVEEALQRTYRAEEDFEVEYRFRGSDGVYRWISTRGRATYDPATGAMRPKGVAFDVTRLRSLVEQRETLLKEVHHRVKNNLQVISSLLNLQARAAGPELTAHFQDIIARIRAMGRVHDQLYSSGNLAAIEFATYLRLLVGDLVGTYGAAARVMTHLDVPPVTFDLDTATPLGLILSEVIGNAYKHAFPNNRHGNVFVSLTEERGRITVTVRDDGAGLPSGFDAPHAGSLGVTLIRGLADRIDADYRFASDGGTTFTLSFRRKSPPTRMAG